MKRIHRFGIAVVAIALFATFCVGRSVVYGDQQDDRAKPRDRDQKQTERRRDDAPPPKSDQRARDRDRNRDQQEDAARRRPQPDPQYRRAPSRESRENDRYHWRNYERRDRGSRHRDRFPRFYFGITLFRGLEYQGFAFGPHSRLHDRYGRLFYWPYYYSPPRGCGWYYVPRNRQLFVDPYSRFEEWEYWGYDRLYICFS